MKMGWRILKNDLGETVTGVWLFEELTRVSEKKGWKVFLLGGWDNVSERAARVLLERFPRIRVMFDEGERVVGQSVGDNNRIITKIKHKDF
jgi:UDP-N-acetyl-D-mannosaminuronic acid transferase (WecB/TagA/CpsF family)